MPEEPTSVLDYQFDPKKTDPLQADLVALDTLEKLNKGKNLIQMSILGKDTPDGSVDPAKIQEVQASMGGLKKTLANYKGYKKARGEEILSYEPEAIARKRALSEEDRANKLVNLHSADEKTFESILQENGDLESFKRVESLTPKNSPVSARERYINKKSMEMYGFSQREIDSGFAEPMFREAIGAAKDEPTFNAVSRWGLSKKNEYDRQRDLGEAASKAMFSAFMGMNDSEKELEEKLSKDFKNLTDSERTAIRAMRNRSYAEMEKKVGHLRPLVKKLYNSVAVYEGTEAKFQEEGKITELFTTEEQVLDAFEKLPPEEWETVTAMLAQTAAANGQEIPSFMAKVYRGFNRSVESAFMGGRSNKTRREIASSRETLTGVEKGESRIRLTKDSVEGMTPSEIANMWVNDPRKIGYVTAPDGEAIGTAQLGEDSPRLRDMTKAELAEVKKLVDKKEKRLNIKNSLYRWQSAVAKSQGDNHYHPSQWAYTLASSLPEMVMSANPVSLAILANSKQGEFMEDFKVANPNADIEQSRMAAGSAAVAYAALNKMQLDILMKGGVGKGVVSKLIIGTMLESGTEVAQDLTMPLAQKFYGIMDESMPDVQLLGEDGKILESVKNFPKYAFAMFPLIALSVGGHSAAKYMDKRQLNKLLKDENFLAEGGFSTEEIAALKKMSLDEAIESIKGRNIVFTEDSATFEEIETGMREQAMRQPTSYTMEYGRGRGYTIAGNGQTIFANTAEEAVEGIEQVAPQEFLGDGATGTGGNVKTPASTTENFQAQAVLNNPAAYSPESLGSSQFGEPIRWTMETENVGNVRNPVGHPAVTKAATGILKVLGSNTPIRFSGKKVPRSARGVYWLKARMIRVRKNNGVSTVFHEIGHAIEDQFLEGGIGDNKWVKVRKATPELATELEQLGNALYQGQAPKNTTLSEGFAEYTRMLMEGVHDMNVVAPYTHAWFTKNILDKNPELAAEYKKVQEVASQFARQGSINRAYGGIVRTPSRIKTIKADFLDFASTFEDKWIDALYPLKRITQAARDIYGKELPVDPFEKATALSMTHDATVKRMVNDNMVDWAGNSFGNHTSLDSILAPFKSDEDRKNLAIYLWAKRTLAMNQGGVKKRDSGLSVEDANYIFDKLNSPLFETTARRIYEWNDSVLQYAADSSTDFANVVARIREFDVGNYIPLFREFEQFDKAYTSRPPSATSGKLIKALTGSTRRIKDPFASMIYNAREIVLRANQRAVIEQLLQLVRTVPSISNVIFEVTPDRVPAAHRSVVDALDAISKAVADSDEALEALELAKDEIEAAGLADEMLTFWGEAYMPTKATENPIIPIYYKGKRRWFEVDRTAYDAIMGMETFRIKSKLFDLFVAMPNRMFKLGTTGYRASFSMATNPSRDISTLYHNTRSKAGMAKIAAIWSHTMFSSLVESLSGGTLVKSEWKQLYKNLGLEMASSLGADLNHTELAAKRIFRGKVMRYVHPDNILEYIRDVFQYAESASRITEMKLLADEIGWDIKKDKLTPEIATKLAVAAKQVTTDFTAAGSNMKWINQVMPFSNAQIQGMRSHYDAYNRNPATFILKGMIKAGASLALWMTYKDEEWWTQMPMNEKYRYTYIPTENELIRIPRAFEIDGFFMALPMAIADAINQEDPELAMEWARYFTSNVVPTTLPVVASVPIELAMNKDMFFDRPIIPKSELDLSFDGYHHLQYGSHNTTLAVELGEMFDKSPRQIDHVIKKFTGGAGADFAALFGRGADLGVTKETALSDTPIVGTFFSPVGKSSFRPKAIDEVYDKLEFVNARFKASKITGDAETQDERQMRLLLKDVASHMSALNEIGKLTITIKEQRQVDQMKLTLAKDALKAFEEDAATTSRADFTKWKKEAEALELEKKKTFKMIVE